MCGAEDSEEGGLWDVRMPWSQLGLVSEPQGVTEQYEG